SQGGEALRKIVTSRSITAPSSATQRLVYRRTVKRPADPLQHLLVLRVIRVANCLQEAGIASNTATILGRAGVFARDAARVVFTLGSGDSTFSTRMTCSQLSPKSYS